MTTPLPSPEASSPRVDLPGPPPLGQDTHPGTQGSTGPVPAPGWDSWAGGTPRGHRSQCVSTKRGGGWGVNCDPCPRTQTSARPSVASYLAGAQRAERVIIWRPASPMGALLSLEEAGVGVSRSPGAAGFGWRGSVRAEHSRQRGQSGQCGDRCIQSPGRPRSLSPRRRQAQAAHLALVGDVHLGGEAG